MSSSFMSGFLEGFAETFLERERMMQEPPDLKALQTNSTIRMPGTRIKGRLNEVHQVSKCSYCLNLFHEKYEQCPTCGGREFI